MFDNRLLRVSIEIGNDLRQYDGVDIVASGQKFGNSLQGEAKVSISNLSRDDREYLLTVTSPYNQQRETRRLIIEAGRESTGYKTVYVGDIWRVNITQPPDIRLNMECLTGQILKQQAAAVTQPSTVPLSEIGSEVGRQLGLTVQNSSTDFNISNYAFSGPALKMVDSLNDTGAQAFVDGNVLVIKDKDKPIPGAVRVLSEDSGLIGVPEILQSGVKVKYLFDHTSRVGGRLRLSCKRLPAADGDYQIYKLGFELSNRSKPFYWIAEAARL